MSIDCSKCGTPFQVSKTDLAYYAKVSPVIGGLTLAIPPPTHCTACREQRRLAWRNERFLYHRKCDLSGKMCISCFSPDTDIKAYEHHEWFSDKWDAKSFGREFDFSRSFFEQFAELQRDVPQLGLSVWNSENADYCNYVGHVRNSYLIFGSVYSEDCYYGSPYYSKDCVDTLVVRECERCYECVDCRKLHTCFYCQDCHSSNDLIYCYDLLGCKDCIGCAGLRNKQYCIFNNQYSREKYETMKQELDLNVPEIHQKLRSELQKLSLTIPRRYMQANQAENVSGNYIYQCKNVHDSFYTDRSEDCSYCAQVVDLKDCMDNNYTEENELCNEYLGAYQNNRVCFSKFCNLVNDALYCDCCHSSGNLFGCIAVRNSRHCILNKQYEQQEHEKLVTRIIEHMRETGEWGEFFPIALSPFGYNETVAQEYFPLEESAVSASGWNWRKIKENAEMYKGPVVPFPESVENLDASFCEKILQCEKTGKLYRIIDRELEFYKSLHLPIPRFCPNVRNSERLSLRNPRQLWDRSCSKCQIPIRTSYHPERPEIVYCESCYLSSVR